MSDARTPGPHTLRIYIAHGMFTTGLGFSTPATIKQRKPQTLQPRVLPGSGLIERAQPKGSQEGTKQQLPNLEYSIDHIVSKV